MSTLRDEFTTFDIIKALGIPRERLQDWINRGFVKPSVPAEGKGTKAIFTRGDVYAVALFKSLLKIGFKRDEASKFINHIVETGRFDAFKRIFLSLRESDGETKISFLPDVWDLTEAEEFLVEDIERIKREGGLTTKEEEEDFIRRWRELGADIVNSDEFGKEARHFRDLMSIRAGLDPVVRKFHAIDTEKLLGLFFNDGNPEFKGDEWDYLHIVNIEKIRRNVDMALSGLE